MERQAYGKWIARQETTEAKRDITRKEKPAVSRDSRFLCGAIVSLRRGKDIAPFLAYCKETRCTVERVADCVYRFPFPVPANVESIARMFSGSICGETAPKGTRTTQETPLAEKVEPAKPVYMPCTIARDGTTDTAMGSMLPQSPITSIPAKERQEKMGGSIGTAWIK